MKQTKKQKLIEMIGSNDNAVTEVYKDITIISYTKTFGGKDVPCIAVWEYKSHKPSIHYKCESNEDVQKLIEKRKHYADVRENEHNLWKKKGDELKSQIEVGSIFYASWGYDQTNIDFFQVIEKKNDFVKLQAIGSTMTSGSHWSGKVMPDTTVKLETVVRRKINHLGNVSIKSYMPAFLWDGSAVSFTGYA